MAEFLEEFVPSTPEDSEKYIRLRWRFGITLGDLLDKVVDVYPDKEALWKEQAHLQGGPIGHDLVFPRRKRVSSQYARRVGDKRPGRFYRPIQSPEENAKAFNEEGFFRAGDFAMIDERGVITLTG